MIDERNFTTIEGKEYYVIPDTYATKFASRLRYLEVLNPNEVLAHCRWFRWSIPTGRTDPKTGMSINIANPKSKSEGRHELFVSIENAPNKSGVSRRWRGWFRTTPTCERYFKSLIQDNYSLRSIRIVEQDEIYLCIFQDGIGISERKAAFRKDPFRLFMSKIVEE